MTGGARAATRGRRTPARTRRRRTRATVVVTTLVVLGCVLALLRATVVTPTRVTSASMAPTLEPGDVVLVTADPPSPDGLDRGDLVVFRSPADGRPTLKRVVGLPGEEVVVLDGRLHVDGRAVPEPWVAGQQLDGYYTRTFTVPRDAVLVLGDNRYASIDSRDHGPVPAEDLLGRVLLRVPTPG